MLNGVVLGLLMKPVPMKPSLEPPDIIASTAQSPTGQFLTYSSGESRVGSREPWPPLV